ncbi:hypothetical protein [Parvibacter caecicola]|uniref:Uncharacterized protein n=1 Tax=Parvibacter caecicola TaxID=747645 RepID=A0A4T9T636_9ACTN|nr:hypothetical protein [Parvibacter caecicola]TJW09731.1 hypothetical protein E5982_08765 [Parvibacter caecicola]
MEELESKSDSEKDSVSCTPAMLPEACKQELPPEIIDFYLTKAPYAKSDKGSSRQSIRLDSFNWSGAGPLGLLMNWISWHFIDGDSLLLSFHASKKVDKRLGLLGLSTNEVNLYAQRGALTISNTISLDEEGQCRCTLNETYCTCFFRHIRNSIAHAFYLCYDNGWVLLRDASCNPGTAEENMSFTGGLLVTLDFLYELMEFVKKGYENGGAMRKELAEGLSGKTYRVELNRTLDLEHKESKEG